jgi:hypothetical protein
LTGLLLTLILGAHAPDPPPRPEPPEAEFVPPAAAGRFPPAYVAERYAALAAGHADWAAEQAVMHPSECPGYAGSAARRAYVWGVLWAAHGGASNVRDPTFGGWRFFGAEEAVQELARLLGEEAFAAGFMPPPLPCWEWEP